MSVLRSHVIWLGSVWNSVISRSRDMPVYSLGASWFCSSMAVMPLETTWKRTAPFSRVMRSCSTVPQCTSCPFSSIRTRNTSFSVSSEMEAYPTIESWV